jgi:hypothetical protein
VEDQADYRASCDENIKTLIEDVLEQRRERQRAAVRELDTQRDAAMKTAKAPPERIKIGTVDELVARASTGTLVDYDTTGRVRDIVTASALNHDFLVLVEEQPALCCEATGLNVMQLRGRLQHANHELASLRFAIEGRRSPHMRTTPAIDRSWSPLLNAARGETEK